jgi:aspartokinase
MITIQKRVEEIIKGSPLYEESLAAGLANISALARKIRPLVEKRRMEKVQLGAVSMALRRMLAERQRSMPAINAKVVSDIAVRSALAEYVLPASPELLSTHQKLLQLASKKRDVFLQMAHGNHEAMVIFSQSIEREVNDLLGKQKPLVAVSDLAAVTMRLADTMFTPGVYYSILRALAWERINFIEIISVGSELTIIFEEKNIERAFSTIKNLSIEYLK